MIIETIAKYFRDLVIIRGKNHTYLVMDIYLLDNNKLAAGMKIYIQEDILFFDEDVLKNYHLQKIQIYMKLIYTPLHYQRSRQKNFIPLFQIFYGNSNEHDEILKPQLLFFVLELSHQRNKKK